MLFKEKGLPLWWSSTVMYPTDSSVKYQTPYPAVRSYSTNGHGFLQFVIKPMEWPFLIRCRTRLMVKMLSEG